MVATSLPHWMAHASKADLEIQEGYAQIQKGPHVSNRACMGGEGGTYEWKEVRTNREGSA
jgi:hypothetical protein